MQDELTAIGRDRWRGLAGEADRERRARAIARGRRALIRERLAAVLVALAARLAPAVQGPPDWATAIPAPPPPGAREAIGGAGHHRLSAPADRPSRYQGSGGISLN